MNAIKALLGRIKAFFKAHKTTILTAMSASLALDMIMMVISITAGGMLGAALAA